MQSQLKNVSPQNQGFALLFTVLLISLILSIALSISNLTLKQSVLSNLVKDSQVSFYQADTAIECGLYQDTIAQSFPLGSDPGMVPSSFSCGASMVTLDTKKSTVNYFVYDTFSDAGNGPCFSIVFDKLATETSGTSRIEGYGYNICTTSPRQVERALEVTY